MGTKTALFIAAPPTLTLVGRNDRVLPLRGSAALRGTTLLVPWVRVRVLPWSVLPRVRPP